MKKNNFETLVAYLDKHNDIAKILAIGLIAFSIRSDLFVIFNYFMR